MSKPGQFQVVKKLGAAQFKLALPTYNEKGWVERDGAIIIECAPGSGQDADGNLSFNWSEKITFSLGMNDLALLFESFEKQLVHQYQGKTKALQFTAGKDKYVGTYMMSVREKTGDTQRQVSVPFTAGETTVLQRLLAAAVSKIIGW